ncbi:MAG: DUF805 domain-containing protein [Dehalococcoidia bacterium]|nr:DUF805 domain-containing protein [Dehalococcoidia bacterium]
MTFKQGIRSGLDNMMNFDERATREEFWWWALLVGLVMLSTVVVGTILVFSAILGGFFLLLLALPTASIVVRRLHDLDRPGWEALAALVPLFGWAYLLMRFTEAGDPVPNQYGRR